VGALLSSGPTGAAAESERRNARDLRVSTRRSAYESDPVDLLGYVERCFKRFREIEIG
jgi:hypothetical protein